MIRNKVIALAISERLRLMGLPNRWYSQVNIEDFKEYCSFVFEVYGEKPIHCSVAVDPTNTFCVVPQLSYDIGRGVTNHLYQRTVSADIN